MYLESFKTTLKQKLSGSLFSVSDAKQINSRAKEYLHRLSKSGEVQRIHQGWYYIPEKQDVWEFLAKDKNFKVLIKQTAASIWNYDFIHRNIYRLAVEDQSYKNAVEKFAKDMGWLFEVEYHEKIPYEYRKVDELFVESPESCIASCISEWAFTDAFATLYYKRSEIDFNKLRQLSRWRRISRTHLRVWTAIKYGCKLLNEQLGESMFKVRASNFGQNDVKDLIDEAVEAVMEFA
jgi:hypothetical protein